LKFLRRKRLIVAGVAADNCVLLTAMVRSYSVWIPVATFTALAEPILAAFPRRIL